MKIAHVTATFPPYAGGTGNVAYYNARVLASRGHDVHVFTAMLKTSPDEQTLDGIAVHRLKPWLRYGNAPLLPTLFSQISGFDIIHLHMPFYGGIELLHLLRQQRDTALIITHHQDVKLTGVANIVSTIHDRFIGLEVMSRADRVCFTSLDYAQTSHFTPHLEIRNIKATALPNGVDTSRFAVKPYPERLSEHYQIEDNKFKVLVVGVLDRAHYFKGVTHLLDAIARLENPDVLVFIVGEGELRETYQEHAAKIGLQDVAHFPGFVPDEELPDYYRMADVTVLPSTTPGEAFGLVLLESMACGTPVIASDMPGVRTVVSPPVDGFLFPPGDVKELSDILQTMILLAPEAREQMGCAGRKKVVREYDWNRIGDILESLYMEVLDPEFSVGDSGASFN